MLRQSGLYGSSLNKHAKYVVADFLQYSVVCFHLEILCNFFKNELGTRNIMPLLIAFLIFYILVSGDLGINL